MASDLLSIAASGTRAARSALDITAQNIANASTEGYVRRSVQLSEVSASSGILRSGDISLSGVRVSGVTRNTDAVRQAEVRRTGSDLARANTDLAALKGTENAIEQAGVYDAVVDFEASLLQLTSNPTDPSLRAAAVAGAQTMADKFNIAASSLEAVGDGVRFDAAAKVEEANTLGSDLARINQQLARTGENSSDRATLLDQRDLLLTKLSDVADVSTQFASNGTVTVRLGGSTGAVFVEGNASASLSVSEAANGTISFAVDGQAITPTGGSLAGSAQALSYVAETRTRLDALADGIAATVNDAQSQGAALDGSDGQPLFTGSGAAGMSLGFTNGALLATAPAGSDPSSRDASNLTGLRSALETGGAASGASSLLFDISSRVASRQTTQEALASIAIGASDALKQQAGVDLDDEAANLLRFQLAFQASGRAMQVANDIFDTLLSIR